MISNPFNAEKWAQDTFGNASLGNKQRTRRLVDIGKRMATHSGKSAAFACEGNEALVEGTYRFIRNDNVSAEAIRWAGFESLREQVEDVPYMLALEDTTSLSYKHQVATSLGKLGKVTDKSRGFWVQSVLMLHGQTFQTLGLAHQEWWCRPDDPNDADEKESGKWQASSVQLRRLFGESMERVISVCDREADIFDYMSEKLDYAERFIVRAKHKRKVNEGEQALWEHLREQPCLGKYEVEVQQKGLVDKKGNRRNRAARSAKVSLRSTEIRFNRQGKELVLNVVLAEEMSPPKGIEPLEWMLLTTEPVTTFEEAIGVIQKYSARWRVEDFHKAWKSGAGAERQRMAAPEHLERMVSILAFVAVRLMRLRESFTLPILLKRYGLLEQAKKVAAQDCQGVLTEDEWRLLVAMDKGKKRPETEVPSLQWVYLAIARLGGFTDTKRTGLASWATIWEGWDKLQERLTGYIFAKDLLSKGIKL